MENQQEQSRDPQSEQKLVRATGEKDANARIVKLSQDGWRVEKISGEQGACWILFERAHPGFVETGVVLARQPGPPMAPEYDKPFA